MTDMPQHHIRHLRGKRKGRFAKAKKVIAQENVLAALTQVQVEKRTTPFIYEPRRIVDLIFLGKELWCKRCDKPLSLKNRSCEVVYGLASTMKVKCMKCRGLYLIHTHPRNPDGTFDINSNLESAIHSESISESQINSILSSLEIPTVQNKTLKTCGKYIDNTTNCTQNVDESVKKESLITEVKTEVSSSNNSGNQVDLIKKTENQTSCAETLNNDPENQVCPTTKAETEKSCTETFNDSDKAVVLGLEAETKKSLSVTLNDSENAVVLEVRAETKKSCTETSNGSGNQLGIETETQKSCAESLNDSKNTVDVGEAQTEKSCAEALNDSTNTVDVGEAETEKSCAEALNDSKNTVDVGDAQTEKSCAEALNDSKNTVNIENAQIEKSCIEALTNSKKESDPVIEAEAETLCTETLNGYNKVIVPETEDRLFCLETPNAHEKEKVTENKAKGSCSDNEPQIENKAEELCNETLNGCGKRIRVSPVIEAETKESCTKTLNGYGKRARVDSVKENESKEFCLKKRLVKENIDLQEL